MRKMTERELYDQELKWLLAVDKLPKTETGEALATDYVKHVATKVQKFGLRRESQRVLRHLKRNMLKLKQQDEEERRRVLMQQRLKEEAATAKLDELKERPLEIIVPRGIVNSISRRRRERNAVFQHGCRVKAL